MTIAQLDARIILSTHAIDRYVERIGCPSTWDRDKLRAYILGEIDKARIGNKSDYRDIRPKYGGMLAVSAAAVFVLRWVRPKVMQVVTVMAKEGEDV